MWIVATQYIGMKVALLRPNRSLVLCGTMRKSLPTMRFCVDLAFTYSAKVEPGNIARARKTNKTAEIPNLEKMYAIGVVQQRMMPTERRSPEWGVRALKGPTDILDYFFL